MKKSGLILLLVVLVVGCEAQKGFDIGVFGTFTNTYIWRQNNYGTLAPFQIPIVRQSEMAYKATWHGTGGFEAGYNFTNNFGVKAAIQYSTAGQKYEDNFDGPAIIPGDTFGNRGTVNVKRIVRLSYIQIPVMFKYTAKGKVFKFYAALGPQFGIRNSAYEQVQIEGHVYLPDSLNFSPNQKFRSFDVGVVLQFGLDIYVVKQFYIEVGLSGYCGVIDLNGAALRNLGWYDKNHLSYQSSHNSSAGLTVGLHYIFKQKAKGVGAKEETDKTKPPRSPN